MRKRTINDLTQEDMDIFVIYMDKETRERIYNELAPCTPAEFLKRYYKFDPSFESFVESEMGFYFD